MKQKTIKMGSAHVSETGYAMTFARATAAKKEFTLTWAALPTSYLDTLMAYFDENKGGIVSWTYPGTTTVYDVVFMDNEIEFDKVTNQSDRWAGTIVLREA
jgi:hypothetical protein